MQNFNEEPAGFIEQIKKSSYFVLVGILFFLFVPKASRAADENTPSRYTNQVEVIIAPTRSGQRGEPEREQVIQSPRPENPEVTELRRLLVQSFERFESPSDEVRYLCSVMAEGLDDYPFNLSGSQNPNNMSGPSNPATMDPSNVAVDDKTLEAADSLLNLGKDFKGQTGKNSGELPRSSYGRPLTPSRRYNVDEVVPTSGGAKKN